MQKTAEDKKILEIYSQRMKQTEEDYNMYPHTWSNNININQLLLLEQNYQSGDRDQDLVISFSGRVMLKRSAGKKLFFYTISSNNKTIQFAGSKKEYYSDNFLLDNKKIMRGDIVGVKGYLGKTHKGELTIFFKEIHVLTPCLHPLSKTFVGISDINLRYRNRYLDMIINPKVNEIFIKRSLIINWIRAYLVNKDFVEVETPVLQNQFGGASAKPFKTFHNDMKQDMFMRIAPEIFLKKLVIGGLDRVFEIGKQFRNESADMTHNPEFTSMEFYMAYADYNNLMDMTEHMLSSLVMDVNKSNIVEFTDRFEKKWEIDFTPPYNRIDLVKDLEKELQTSIPINENDDIMEQFLLSQLEIHQIKCPNPKTLYRMYDKLIEHFIEPKCVKPTFLINHPRFMSPLAKWHRDNPKLSERFELFIAGMELCNAYTELNHPYEQKLQFLNQLKDREKGDTEAADFDTDYIKALEYGLPPTGGFGMGIDRLVMLLTNNSSIREVIPFPFISN